MVVALTVDGDKGDVCEKTCLENAALARLWYYDDEGLVRVHRIYKKSRLVNK